LFTYKQIWGRLVAAKYANTKMRIQDKSKLPQMHECKMYHSRIRGLLNFFIIFLDISMLMLYLYGIKLKKRTRVLA